MIVPGTLTNTILMFRSSFNIDQCFPTSWPRSISERYIFSIWFRNLLHYDYVISYVKMWWYSMCKLKFRINRKLHGYNVFYLTNLLFICWVIPHCGSLTKNCNKSGSQTEKGCEKHWCGLCLTQYCLFLDVGL